MRWQILHACMCSPTHRRNGCVARSCTSQSPPPFSSWNMWWYEYLALFLFGKLACNILSSSSPPSVGVPATKCQGCDEPVAHLCMCVVFSVAGNTRCVAYQLHRPPHGGGLGWQTRGLEVSLIYNPFTLDGSNPRSILLMPMDEQW